MTESTSESVRPPASGARLDLAANLAVAALALAWLARLVPQALAARLQTDECFHAWVSRWIAAHGALPERIEGLYGGFAGFYPPLFHVLGAFAFRCSGLPGFLLVNVAVAAALLAIVAAAGARSGAPAAARWAVCLCLANGFLAEHAVRLYVEALSTLLVAAAAPLLVRVVRTGRAREGVVLGFLAGLAITAKLSGLVLPPILFTLAAVMAARGRRAPARALGLAGVVALAVAAPLFARNALLYGSPVYPAFGHDLNARVMALNVSHFTPSPGALWAETMRRAGPAVLAFVAAALALSAARRRDGAEAGVIAGAIVLVLAAPLQALVEARHLLPLVVAAGTLAAGIVARALADRAALRRTVDLALLALAAWAVIAMPRWRTREDLDESPGLEQAFAAIRAHVPAGETVLARETYDAFWYTGRPANWPVPFGQRDAPLEMFLTADPDSVAGALRRHDLRWALITDEPRPGPFNGADWPASFASAVDTLCQRGRAREVWSNDDARLVRFAD